MKNAIFTPDLGNTVKHAEGRSAVQLRERRPELFEHPYSKLLRRDAPRFFPPLRLPLAGDGLYVTEEVLDEYVSAVAGLLGEIASHFDGHAKEYYPLE